MLARRKQVDAGIGGQRPVAVLARTVDAGKGFFMQQYSEMVFRRHFAHQIHQHQVVIDGQVGFFVNRRKFKLIGSHLVMTRFQRNAQFISFQFQVFHVFHHALGN